MNELKTVFVKNGLKLPTINNEKFTELDTNKNGKIERSEVRSEGEGEDYWGMAWLLGASIIGWLTTIAMVIADGGESSWIK